MANTFTPFPLPSGNSVVPDFSFAWPSYWTHYELPFYPHDDETVHKPDNPPTAPGNVSFLIRAW